MEISQIQEFYKNTKVFITGATGFVGKTLIEKLLRSTDVDTIYILIREKKGKSPEERINKIFENPVFELVKSQKPDCKSKIKPIVGECGTPGFNITDSEMAEIISNVHIIFHVAATVNFDENLKTSYEINVKGTETVLDMAKKMKKLKALVYVSTAYSNCIKETVIEEKVYDYPFDDVVEKITKMTKEEAEVAAEKILGKWPNTYTLTKAIAEMVVKKEGKNLPIGIFRPSIIVSTYTEPMPGWLDNIYAINGTSAGILSGFLRVIPSRTDTVIDVVPVDKCISALMVSAWEIAEKGKIKNEEDILVFNYTSGNENPLTNGLLNHLNFAYGVPTAKALWFPYTVFVTNTYVEMFLSFFLQILPAIFMDALAIVTGGKPQLLSMYLKVSKFMSKVKFFGLREWEFDNTNVQTLWKKISKTDQELFPFSMSLFSWPLFCQTYLLGIRRYILKDDDSTIPKAMVKYYRFRIAHYTLAFIIFYLLWYLLHTILNNIFPTIM